MLKTLESYITFLKKSSFLQNVQLITKIVKQLLDQIIKNHKD